MAKRTIRIPLFPNKIDKFIELMKSVVAEHENQGASSPLSDPSFMDMADFKAKVLQAETLRRESIEARATAEAKMHEAKQLLGIGVGQTIDSDTHLYHHLNRIKGLLLAKFAYVPKELCLFGFEVIIGTAKGVGRPGKKKE
ncbi:MAG: hypothetical protein V4615_13535 [Bacteroidota bacterium]